MSDDVIAAIRTVAKVAELISPAANVAFQEAMRADSMIASSNEFKVIANDTTYIAQLACYPNSAAEAIYYCPSGQWDHVQKISIFDAYYVDATNGLDTNSGTSEATPWKTLARVKATTLKPGDRVLLKRGETWRGENFHVSNSGTPTRPIFYGAYGSGANPIIDPTIRSTDWTVYSGNVWQRPFGWQDPFQVFEDGVRLAVATGVDLLPGQWYIQRGKAIYVRCTDDGNPNTDHVIEHLSTTTALMYSMAFCFNSQSWIDVRGIDITKAWRGYSWEFNADSNVPQYRTHDITVADCVVSWCGSRAFAMGSSAEKDLSNITITNCVAHDCNAEGVWLGNGRNIKVIGCEVYNGMKEKAKFPHTPDTGGICIGIRSESNLVKNCYVHDNYTGNCIGVEYEAGSPRPVDVVIDSNRVDLSTPDSTAGIGNAGTNTIIKNNVIRLLVGGTGKGGMIVGAGADGTKIYHNTYVIATEASVDGWAINLNSANSNTTIKNNIFCSTRTLHGIYMGALATGVVLDGNDYYGADGIQNRYRDGAYSHSIAEWRTKTGQEAHSISSNPKFVANYTDLHLQASSPCKGAGVDVGVAYDHDGNSRLHGTAMPTIGAYE